MSSVHLCGRAEGPYHMFFRLITSFFGVHFLFFPFQNVVNIDFSYEFYTHYEGGQVYYNCYQMNLLCPLLKIVTMHLVTYM